MNILDGPHIMNTLDYSVTVTNLNPGLTYSFKVYIFHRLADVVVHQSQHSTKNLVKLDIIIKNISHFNSSQ